MLELHRYSPAITRFFLASVEHPDLLVDAPLGPASTVVDAGAYVGDWAAQIVDRYGSTVHAFEPGPQAFALLERRFGDRPEVVVHPEALSDRDGHAVLDVDPGPGSTIHADAPRDGSPTVACRDVDAAFADLHLDRIDLLKLNIEGAEFDVLDRLIATGRVGSIGTISVQFHEWHPDAHRRRRRIRQALRRTHREVWCYPWVWELWTRDLGPEGG